MGRVRRDEMNYRKKTWQEKLVDKKRFAEDTALRKEFSLLRCSSQKWEPR
ncbi:hypothetical protein KEJ34_07535 [Candidatus Bathyarchaeota archaeon]|nr:hypothetical protein [Candidatus Bathyarchaeota archaeon]